MGLGGSKSKSRAAEKPATPTPAPPPSQQKPPVAAPSVPIATPAAPAPAPVMQPPPKKEEPVKPAAPPPPQPAPAPVPAKPVPTAGEEVDDENAFALLVCGTGESGKTTFVRQLMLKFKGVFDAKMRKGFIQTIRGNLIEAMQMLLAYCEKNSINLSDEGEDYANSIRGLNAMTSPFTRDVAKALEKLWKMKEIQAAFADKDQTLIPDNIDYFFGKIKILAEPTYEPTSDDVLRARVRSIGVDKVYMNMEGAPIRFYDVGGQKSERGKWDALAEEVGGLIYVVSLADFDKPMFEGGGVLRIFDSIEVFKHVLTMPKFEDNCPIFIIGNKFDRFAEKIARTDSDCFIKIFPAFTGDAHNVEVCASYLFNQFLAVAAPMKDTRPIKVYKQNSLDQANVWENTAAMCRFVREQFFGEE